MTDTRDGQDEILIVLIHNRDDERLAILRPFLRSLADRLRADLIEVFEQPEIRPIPWWSALTREWVYWLLDRRQRRYLGRSNEPLARSLARFLHLLIGRYLRDRGVSRETRRKACIERLLTRKHVEAWDRARAYRYAIVMEDDAVFAPTTVARFAVLIEMVRRCDAGRALYADLAGGFDFDAIGIDGLEIERADGFRRFSKMVTNTTCAYLIDRRAADLFTARARHWYAGINPDWFLNRVAHDLERRRIATDCFHGDPPLWHHGSMTGYFRSSMR